MKRAIRVDRWVPPGVLATGIGVINVVPPQRGKTRRTIWDFMEQARHGDTLVYAVSSHAEAVSVIKHYVELQRQYNWELRCLLIVYAGLNRWCPLYYRIREERRKLGYVYRQNKFCKENCDLWRMKVLPKELFEPGARAIWIRKKGIHRKDKNLLVHGPIRIILNKYDYHLLKKLYPEICNSVDFQHHTIVIYDGEESQEYGKPIMKKGCIRALIMRKLIDVTERDRKGRLKGKHRRSVYGYPTIIVIPHHLLPMILHFARIYSARVFVVMDEFDRLLTIKVPRYLAERYRSLPKPKDWDWKEILETFPWSLDSRSNELSYANILTFKVELRREINTMTGRPRVLEVPLITLVSLELDELKKKGKLHYLGVVGSSVPLLPKPILEYLVTWMKKYFNDVFLYYDFADIPVHYNIPYIPRPNQLPPGTLIIYGSREIAVSAAIASLNLNFSEVKIPINPNEPAELTISRVCKKAGYDYRGKGLVCISKNRKKAIVWKVGYEIERDEPIPRYLLGMVFYIPKDYIKISGRYVSWLGGRITRGVMLPRKIKYMVIATSGKTLVVEKGLAGEEIKEKYRILDMLQVLFRINSRPDITVWLTPWSKPVLIRTIEWYNRHVAELVEMVENQ